MSDAQISDFMRQSSLSFTGTVTHVEAATMSDVPVNKRTLVMHVDSVLHAPDSLKNLAGSQITVQLKARSAMLKVGDSITLFTEPTAFGDTLAVQEIGRLKVAAVASRLMTAAADGSMPMADLSAAIETERLTAHARAAAAVVTGRVTNLTKAEKPQSSEHDPDWWIATLAVNQVELGAVKKGNVKVLYANSKDVRWRNHPKPKAAQEGTWILHAADPSMSKYAAYVLDDSDDLQTVQFLDSLRTEG